MKEVYQYDFETKQCILQELEEESNASLDNYEDPPVVKEEEDTSENDDIREETQQVNQCIRLTHIAPIWPLPLVTITNRAQSNTNLDRSPEDGPPDGEPPGDDEPKQDQCRYQQVAPQSWEAYHRYSWEILPKQQNSLKKSSGTFGSIKTYQDSNLP